MYTTLAVSASACVVVTLMTPRIEDEVSAGFYAKVRPFGLWGEAESRARAMGLPLASSIPISRVVVNVALAGTATYSLYMAPIYFLGHWPLDGAVCSAIFALCAICLYFTWYKTLPND